MDDRVLLSSGEFSKVCHVSRELLIHYDKIGLLKPKVVQGNGYRYYSLEQLYLFDAIRFFVDTGMSTKEIKNYFDDRTTPLFLEKIQNNIKSMKQQRAIMDARIGMMEKMRYITHRALLFPKGEPRLSFWDELFMLVTDIPNTSQEAYARAIGEHSDFCRNVAFVSKFPLGRIVDVPDRDNPADIIYRQLQTWVSEPEDLVSLGDRLAVRPKGNYAVILHQGGMQNIAESYVKLFEYIQTQGYVMRSPVYEIDMNSYIMSKSEDDYLIHISVLVDT
jgi:DNA-binding transcriptional MerR regulator